MRPCQSAIKLNVFPARNGAGCSIKQHPHHAEVDDMRFATTSYLAALLIGLVAGAPAMAQTTIDFTGTDGTATMTGTAEVASEGYDLPLLAFNVDITNLSAEGGPLDSVSFNLADVSDGYWFDPSNPDGLGFATFTFDLNGTGPNQSIYTGYSCFYNCFDLTGGVVDDVRAESEYYGFATTFTTTVTSYSTAAVPEPASVAILGMGIIGLGGYRVRRRRLQTLIA
jgi:hypothetical protein